MCSKVSGLDCANRVKACGLDDLENLPLSTVWRLAEFLALKDVAPAPHQLSHFGFAATNVNEVPFWFADALHLTGSFARAQELIGMPLEQLRHVAIRPSDLAQALARAFSHVEEIERDLLAMSRARPAVSGRILAQETPLIS